MSNQAKLQAKMKFNVFVCQYFYVVFPFLVFMRPSIKINFN